MIYPFTVIESKTTSRYRFEIEDGVQPTHALFYIKEGSFSIVIDKEKQKIGVGDCLILPDYIQFRREIIEPIVFDYIKFRRNENCPFMIELPYGKAEFKDRERFISNVTILERFMDNDSKEASCYREHILLDMLFQLHFESNPIKEAEDEYCVIDKTLYYAVNYIRSNLDKKILIEDVCKAVGSNQSTLNFKFRRETNKSVGEFIVSEKMKKARKLLSNTTYSITEIALRCGYENLYYFSNAFKKQHGVSPVKYREQ